jgi:hypothetical protein
MLRSLIEKGALEIYSSKVLRQLSNFVPKNGTYNAAPGEKDDLVANLWMFGWYSAQDVFEEHLKNTLVKELYGPEIEETIAMSISVDRGDLNKRGNHNDFW